jgi:hypothetical protein
MDKPAMKNPYLVTIDEWLATEGKGMSRDEFIGLASQLFYDDYGPALCTEGCDVDDTGLCAHGCPSILRELGLSPDKNGFWVADEKLARD